MTDKEIKQALHSCYLKLCDDCPLNKKQMCRKKLLAYLVDLINRQQAEIERLKEVARAEAIKEFAEKLKEKSISRYERW